mmetsp:Transcript_8739/g.26858  ORF Transcript_8739/g.26858 Transcript_8739/m.26858 type:complete len:233 (-) Transcript_8739:281-979(-)
MPRCTTSASIATRPRCCPLSTTTSFPSASTAIPSLCSTRARSPAPPPSQQWTFSRRGVPRKMQRRISTRAAPCKSSLFAFARRRRPSRTYHRLTPTSRFMWGSSTACAMPRASHSHPFSRASVTSATGSSALTAPLTPTIPIWRTPEPPGASSPSSPSRWLTAWLATHNRRATVLRATAETTESGAHVCTCGAREGGLGVGQPPPCIAMMRSIPPASNAEYVQTIALGRFVA